VFGVGCNTPVFRRLKCLLDILTHRNTFQTSRAVFTHGPKGPGSRAANFQGQHVKKTRLKCGMQEKKAVHEREI
jgi:hypothetical protein